MMRVVICGAGVIGSCIAFFLARRGVAPTVVERYGVACAASGKSGGFLALDWCDGSPLGALARRSFALHAELAGEFADHWGYRRVETLSVIASARRDRVARRGSRVADWLGERAALHGRLGTPETTAQIHPARFTRAIMDAAAERGAVLRRGAVTGVTLDADRSAATGVIVDGETVEADAVVIAMGPWSALAAEWLPLPAVDGLKGNSVLFDTRGLDFPRALFVELEDEAGRLHTPEVFPRADGTTYVSGLSSHASLPDDPEQVAPDPGAGERLQAMTRAFAPVLGDAPVLATNACFRPVTRDGMPLLGPVPGVANAYVATGHSVWGMLNAPASGEAMAELLTTGTTSRVDLAPFDPARLPH